MTIEEFIARLQDYPPDMKIVLAGDGCNHRYPRLYIGENKRYLVSKDDPNWTSDNKNWSMVEYLIIN
jgi:hypothetical protein